jgi:hypothetical protein
LRDDDRSLVATSPRHRSARPRYLADGRWLVVFTLGSMPSAVGWSFAYPTPCRQPLAGGLPARHPAVDRRRVVCTPDSTPSGKFGQLVMPDTPPTSGFGQLVSQTACRRPSANNCAPR